MQIVNQKIEFFYFMKKSVKLYGNEGFSKRFKMLMTRNDLRLEDIASHTGNALSTVSTWKRGRLPKKDQILEKLAEIFDVPKDYLRFGDECVFANESAPADSLLRREIESYFELVLREASGQKGGLERVREKLAREFPLHKRKAN